MKKYFCCPECGSENLQLIEEKTPFSWAKAIIGGIFLGAIGLLFGFLGQDNLKVSSWICEDCRNRFQDPNEMKKSIEKNEKAFNIYFRYCFIILAIAAVLIAGGVMLYGLLFSALLKNPFLIICYILLVILLIGIMYVPNIIVKSLVSYIISSKKEEISIMQNKTKNMDVERDTNGLWHLPDDQW